MCCECINLRRGSRGGALPSGKGNNFGGSHSNRTEMRWEIENVDCRDSESLSEAGRWQEPETCFLFPENVPRQTRPSCSEPKSRGLFPRLPGELKGCPFPTPGNNNLMVHPTVPIDI